ncbi:uncharacterized protein DNG_04776 [Cephalotrichum gorgonifer]|uniref:Uncharacterized protein n=1 Tax=Cephalotrichum gorgonifer TaxID=2041049 RepID=A0AAE8MXV4_9PEZI|nr:uncharacterized protein DNG_04776 [Cephalotrichum gorgonifer]
MIWSFPGAGSDLDGGGADNQPPGVDEDAPKWNTHPMGYFATATAAITAAEMTAVGEPRQHDILRVAWISTHPEVDQNLEAHPISVSAVNTTSE